MTDASFLLGIGPGVDGPNLDSLVVETSRGTFYVALYHRDFDGAPGDGYALSIQGSDSYVAEDDRRATPMSYGGNEVDVHGLFVHDGDPTDPTNWRPLDGSPQVGFSDCRNTTSRYEREIAAFLKLTGKAAAEYMRCRRAAGSAFIESLTLAAG